MEEHLIREFIAEAEEHLASLEPSLLRLEKEPENIALVHEIFLSTHGIKGTASYVGLGHISNFTHILESLLDQLRKRTLRASPNVIDALLEGVDMLKQLIAHVASGSPPPDTSAVERKLLQWPTDTPLLDKHPSSPSVRQECLELSAEAVQALEPEDAEIFADIVNQQIEFMQMALAKLREGINSENEATAEQMISAMTALLKALRNIQSSAAVLSVDALDQIVEAQANYLASFEHPPYTVTEQDLTNIERVIANLQQLAASIAHALTQQPAPLPETPPQPAPLPVNEALLGPHMLRVNADRVDVLLNLISELALSRSKLNRVDSAIKYLHDELRSGKTTLFNPAPGARKKTTRLFKHLKDTLDEVLLDMGRLTNRLQEGTMHIRMIPLSQVVGRFPRMVRDLSRQAGKQVELIMYGAETELDKSVMDVIGEPLIHLLRNAVAHGIEAPEERQKQGKNPQGMIVLSAYHQGNQVLIELSDDGRGIDLALVKAKAVQQQMVSERDVQALTDRELAALIFHPGFSTAETASPLSGRGVGLPIVKRYLEQLNGSIDITTTTGQGVRFTIKLPLTLAIIPALMVRVQTEVFALPLVSVEEAIRITARDIKTIESQQVIRLREKIIPLLKLTDLLGEPIFPTDPAGQTIHPDEWLFSDAERDARLSDLFGTSDQEKLSGVVISDGTREIGVLIDELIGEQDIVIKSLEHELLNVAGVSGASIQGDGQVALVLDAATLITLASQHIRYKKLSRSPKTAATTSHGVEKFDT